MADLPVMLNLDGVRCVVVGGGATAARRARSLVEAGAWVTVIAPEATADLTDWVDGCEKAIHEARGYRSGDLEGALLVVIATDDPTVNAAATMDAHAAGVLVNRADNPDGGDLTFTAVGRRGPVNLAVDTSGISAAAAAAIRDELVDAIDESWVRLLEIAALYRKRIQQTALPPDQRRDRLRQLTDDTAREILKIQGPAALRQHLEALAT